MEKLHPLLKIVGPVRRYLDNELRPHELVKAVDDLVSDGLLSELEPDAAAALDQLQMTLALYSPEETWRSEAPGVLIGELELRERAQKFDTEMRGLYPHVLGA